MSIPASSNGYFIHWEIPNINMKGKDSDMEIAFPTQEDRGIESQVHGHFGSARFFIIVETDNDVIETVVNKDTDHLHGQCQPLSALGRQVDAVSVGGIGGGALRKLRDAGIKVFRAAEGTIHENVKLIRAGVLPEFLMEHTCAGHSNDGGCTH
ncbi:NifB/NifX family molybdenum-iron cluster-binding protein [Desulfococcaceae bacterium HSG8]|nr:NifB/NifX family molybdenum-iron cluster-binding protein [Desulfococcaceae bacterium HSG8]